MDFQTTLRPTFAVCGYAVETTLENNDADIAKLYRDFFDTGKEQSLLLLKGAQSGFYGLEWYTPGHKSFFYLLGKEVDQDCDIPQGALLKVIPPALYAIAHLPALTNMVEAWTEFFYTEIPAHGFSPDSQHGYYFEYYPEKTDGIVQLWTPIVKNS